MIMAMDVASSARSRPNEPSRSACTGASRVATSTTAASSRVITSSKFTVSSKPWLSVSCTVAIVPTRRTASCSADRAAPPAYGLMQRGPRLALGQPARLHAQQGRHRLQVVLHPVVDLADGRVLGHQVALATAQLAHVAQQQDRTGPLSRLDQRDGPHRDARAPG